MALEILVISVIISSIQPVTDDMITETFQNPKTVGKNGLVPDDLSCSRGVAFRDHAIEIHALLQS